MSWFVNLRTQVRRVLGIANGGTGNDIGLARGIVKMGLNRTGSTITKQTLVTLSHTFNDSRIIKTTTYQQTSVLGVVIGYFDDDDAQTIIYADVPDKKQAAVQVQGDVVVDIGSEGATRGQYAYASADDGKAASSATAAAGAFGVFQGSGTAGTGTALVRLWNGVALNTASVSFATPAIVLGTAHAAGAASTVIRSDATILAFDATNPADLGTAAPGDAAVAARRNHVHNAPTIASLAGDLDDLDDVNAPSPGDGDLLSYDSGAGEWVAISAASSNNIWRPLMDGAIPGEVILDGTTGEAIMAFGPQ